MDKSIKEFTAKQKEMFEIHDRIFDAVRRNGGELGEGEDPLTLNVVKYINRCHPGIFDLQDTLGADNMEFLSMAYYGILGSLPDDRTRKLWKSRKEESEWEFRKSVMDSLMASPQITVKQIHIRNNIYQASVPEGEKYHQSWKQRILVGGYQFGRKLPVGIKAPLKKIATKLLMH